MEPCSDYFEGTIIFLQIPFKDFVSSYISRDFFFFVLIFQLNFQFRSSSMLTYFLLVYYFGH